MKGEERIVNQNNWQNGMPEYESKQIIEWFNIYYPDLFMSDELVTKVRIFMIDQMIGDL